jgi:hypothetical protein
MSWNGFKTEKFGRLTLPRRVALAESTLRPTREYPHAPCYAVDAQAVQRILWHKGDAFRRCSEYVRYVRSYCRVGNPARMPPRVTRMVVSRGASEDGGHKRVREEISGPPLVASVCAHHLQHISTITLEFALPTPLTFASSSALAGRSRAMADRVASWKMT